MAEKLESKTSTVVTRSKVMSAIGASFLPITIAFIALGFAVTPRLFGAAILSFIFGSLFAGFVALANPRAKHDASGVVADGEGLTTRAGARFPRDSFLQGVVTSGVGGGTLVRLTRKGFASRVSVKVPSRADGVSLLEAMRLDPAHSIMSFFGMSRVYGSFAAFGANVALLIGSVALLVTAHHVQPLLYAGIFSLVFSYASFFMPMRLTIGQDGIVISWYGKKRFIAYREIEYAALKSDFFNPNVRGVLVRLRGGEEISLPLAYGFFGAGHATQAADRISQAMETYARGEAPIDLAALARGSRTVAEWIVTLRRMGAGANDAPRIAATTSDALWRIVESGSAAASARVAAAVALASGLGTDDRARLRAVADAATAPKLRIALESAAAENADDAALAGALGEFEADDEPAEKTATSA